MSGLYPSCDIAQLRPPPWLFVLEVEQEQKARQPSQVRNCSPGYMEQAVPATAARGLGNLAHLLLSNPPSPLGCFVCLNVPSSQIRTTCSLPWVRRACAWPHGAVHLAGAGRRYTTEEGLRRVLTRRTMPHFHARRHLIKRGLVVFIRVQGTP